MSHTLNQFLTQTQQLQPLLKRLPVVINIVLIIACAQLLSEMIWMLVDDSDTNYATLVSPSGPISSNQNTQKAQQAFRNLSSTHLFGVAEIKAPVVTAENAPDTKLNLVLRGVLSAGSPEVASAIISRGANGQEEIYGIGDKIPGGITLREIHAEYVILERQGRLETLRMIKDEDSSLMSESTQPLASRSTSTTTLSPAATGTLKNIRNDIIKNPASFSKYATPVVVRENGKQIGYRLQAQQNSELLTQAGLEPSDVITSVNGVKLDDMKNSISALSALRSANQVSITVKRNGAEIPLNIQLQ